MFVKLISNLITKLPVIKQFDELGGGIYGTVRAGVTILIIFTIVSAISPIIPDSGIIKVINESHIAKFIYENNVIIKTFL